MPHASDSGVHGHLGGNVPDFAELMYFCRAFHVARLWAEFDQSVFPSGKRHSLKPGVPGGALKRSWS